MNDIDARLARCFHAVFPDLPSGRVNNASIDTVPGWDSVALVNLLNVVSEEFGVELDWERADELTSFAAIRQMVAS